MSKILIFISALFIVITGSITVYAGDLNQESNFHNIVIFIRFNDEETYEAPYSYSYYEELFNGEGVVSLRDYYLEATYGQLTIDSYVINDNNNIIYYTDIYDRAYFEPYSDENLIGVNEGDESLREHELIKRAVDYVDEQNLVPDDIDLDVNLDGELDSITFMISGEDTGWNTLLWPHKWELFTYYNSNGFTTDAPSINGVNPYIYTWELLGNDTDYQYQVDVGVLAHETFHLLSAPDLYHYYNYLWVDPVGQWGLMDNVGSIPSHMLGYMKYEYGNWIDSVAEITESGSYTLYPLQDNPNNLFKIYTGISNEWIYLEYRDDDGFYESTLLDTGLIVYRVNNKVVGNESGSYDTSGTPTDEVFIFRPGMDDLIEPIILIDTEEIIIDGQIDEAALSQHNSYNSIGLGTDIPIFSSDGTILNLNIYNIQEMDGYITFDVFLEPSIDLYTNGVDLKGKEVILYDNHLMEYIVNINNLSNDLQAYYTVDGTTPSLSSKLYEGEDIEITASNNHITVALYNGTELMYFTEEEFTFSTILESDHYPYGDELDIYWYFDFDINTAYSLEFDNFSELELDYDYLYINDGTTLSSFTGTELQNYYVEYYNDYLVINLKTDEYVDEFYGFDVILDPLDDVSLNLLGEVEINHSVNTTYIDLGAELAGILSNQYHIEVINEVDGSVLGDYIITYNVLNESNETIISKTRLVHVIDDVSPILSLNGDAELFVEVNSEFTDPFVTYSDNYDASLVVEVTGSVDTTILATTIITYSVTDSSGNTTEVTRNVTVVDTTAPSIFLQPGVDTVSLGEQWIDSGVLGNDNFTDDVVIDVSGVVNINVSGTYEIIYTMSDASNNTSSISRYVTVLNEEIIDILIICNPFVSTVQVNSNIQISGCFINGKLMTTDTSDIDLTKVGIYEIIDTYELDGVMYNNVRYIYIYKVGTTIDLDVVLEKRRDYA